MNQHQTAIEETIYCQRLRTRYSDIRTIYIYVMNIVIPIYIFYTYYLTQGLEQMSAQHCSMYAECRLSYLLLLFLWKCHSAQSVKFVEL